MQVDSFAAHTQLHLVVAIRRFLREHNVGEVISCSYAIDPDEDSAYPYKALLIYKE